MGRSVAVCFSIFLLFFVIFQIDGLRRGSRVAKRPRAFASQNVSNCADVLKVYANVGYPVTDCVLIKKEFPYLFYRVDAKLNYKSARLACSAVPYSDLAVVGQSDDQMHLNDLFRAKVVLNTWMWIGLSRINGSLQWIDDTGTPPPSRWYPNSDSIAHGDCTVMLMLHDPNGNKDISGTFYYTEDCESLFVAVCQVNVDQHITF